MDVYDLPWGVWLFIGTTAGIAAMAIVLGWLGEWLTGWRTINLLRNRLEMTRLLRREGRPASEPAKWVVTCEHCDYRYDAMTEEDASKQLEKHRRKTNHWVGQRKLDSSDT